MNQGELFETLAGRRDNEIVVYTMSAQKEWTRYSQSPLDFWVAGAMGFASSIGLGLALAQPKRRVWVLDGDGSLLMNLGTLVTIAEQAPPNLMYCVLENGIWELAGRVRLPGAGRASLLAFARSAGMSKTYQYGEMADLEEDLERLLSEPGPLFVSFKVAPGTARPLDRSRTVPAEMARAMERALNTV